MSIHIPILVGPIVEHLKVPFMSLKQEEASGILLDCTFGGGGHTSAFLKLFSENKDMNACKIIAVDQDLSAIEKGREKFKEEIAQGRLELIHSRFSGVVKYLADIKVLGILADLGFSSDQIEDESRGLSFKREGPLDMRLNQGDGVSCFEFLQKVNESELADILWKLGEERYSRKIARKIVQHRSNALLQNSTLDFASLIASCFPPKERYGRIHPATRSFQALRIYLNSELEELESFLNNVIIELKPTGRVAVLSFHSLEDRAVKQAFIKNGFHKVTKKPIVADEIELASNPRARSAKLRVAEKL